MGTLFALLVTLGAPAVTSEDATPRERAMQHVAEGAEHFVAGRYGDALVALRHAMLLEAHISDRAGLYYNIGRVYEEMGRIREAVAAFERSLTHPDTDENRTATRAHIAALSSRLARLLVLCPLGATAALTPAGEAPGEPKACPVDWPRVSPGDYVVTTRSEAGLVVDTLVALAAGDSTAIEPTLPGRLVVEGAPRASTVRVDGVVRSGSPVALELAAGWHTVEVTAPGFVTWQGRVELGVGERDVLAVVPVAEAVDRTGPEALWVAGGAAAVVGGAMVGAGLGGAGDRQMMMHAGGALVSVGVALGVGGLVWWVLQ